ncbi:hypothetical protein [Prevotella sp.]|uniref:hypothetical protein n=1 Tax=Prevotella sp. TaxID=59823 RepID=UPI0040259A2D
MFFSLYCSSIYSKASSCNIFHSLLYQVVAVLLLHVVPTGIHLFPDRPFLQSPATRQPLAFGSVVQWLPVLYLGAVLSHAIVPLAVLKSTAVSPTLETAPPMGKLTQPLCRTALM